MHIDPTSEIAGHPALQIRGLLRKIGDSSVPPEFIAYHLGVGDGEAFGTARALETQGYLEVDHDLAHHGPHYKTTLLGNSLSLASAAKPLTRKTATRKLREFLDRVQEVNANSYYLYKVKRVVLFGSYLTDRDRINDIDVAVEVVSKYVLEEQNQRNAERRREARIEGKHFSTFLDDMFWPESQVMKFLKGRSRAISLHRTSDGILAQAEHQVIYRENEAEDDAAQDGESAAASSPPVS